MSVDIAPLVGQLSGQLNDNAYEVSDALSKIGTDDVVKAMIDLLSNPNKESRFIAARTLALIENNALALEPILIAVNANENKDQAGDLLMALEDFDVSDKYVEIFKLYLFGSFKVSMVAKDLLDFKEFDITARVLKKATKHWNHYCNNVKQDDGFALRKLEVEAMLGELKDYIEP